MTDGQFYTFVGLAVVGLWLLYTAVHTLAIVYRRVDAVNHSVGVLHVAFEQANNDMQRRVHDIVAATERSSGHLNVLVQPIREAEQRRQEAELGIYR